MDHYQRNLWSGGKWEHEDAVYPTAPPVVIPAPRSSRFGLSPASTKTKATFGTKLCFGGLLTMILTLTCVSIYLGANSSSASSSSRESSSYFFDFFFGDDSFFHDGDFTELSNSNIAPTISSSPTGSGVVIEFEPRGEFPLTPQEIYQKNQPSVVYISAASTTKYSTGTGVIISSDGYIVTNAHVIDGSNAASITLWDDRIYPASLVGYDFISDLAVLKIEATDLLPASFTDSDSLEVGEYSYALGNPYGQAYRSTFTDGMISALDRIIEMNDVPLTYVQTTAAINSGNSGGALINDSGQVVGITTIKIMSQKDTIEAMGFAIPSKRVKQIVDRLIEGLMVAPSSIGIVVKQQGTDPIIGLEVVSVEPDCDAFAQGLQEGDFIISANGETIRTIDDLNNVKGYLFAEDIITFVILRDEEEFVLDVKLHETK